MRIISARKATKQETRDYKKGIIYTAVSQGVRERRVLIQMREFIGEVFESLAEKTPDLSGRRFEGCSFVNCSLLEATLRGSSFLDCKFTSCDLSNAHLTNASFRNVRFLDSKLLGINWTSTTAVSHLEFQRCILTYSTFAGRDLRKSIFVECIAREVDFSDVNLSDASCRGTDFAGARFANSNLTKADLREARSYLIRADENKIRGAKFSLPEAISLLQALGIEVEV